MFADADFAGLWDKKSVEEDVSTAKSRSGYILTFAGCPVLWAPKLQTQIALSTTEAECIPPMLKERSEHFRQTCENILT